MADSKNDVKKIHKTSIIREKLAEGEASPFQTYRELTVGRESFSHFVRYEITTCLLGPLPGAAGYLLRKIFYKKLFKHVGRGLIIGRNVVIRDSIRSCNSSIRDRSLSLNRNSTDPSLNCPSFFNSVS